MKWTYRHSIHNITDNFLSFPREPRREEKYDSQTYTFCVSKQIIHSQFRKKRRVLKENLYFYTILDICEKCRIFQWCSKKATQIKEFKFSVINFHSIYSLQKVEKKKENALKIKDKFQNWWLLCERRWAGQGSLHDGKTFYKRWFIKNSLKFARKWRKGKNLCRFYSH
jgi:hypothetical protein